ncbi:porin family protein [Larkinella knui]|uniref:PorT family protein n=1 Tax=Larkinella knui TaxID=2025310 RepID=A0A3P1CC37_9BACT|nr:porin family protein [Larkinella knui]RRB10646.1 PorT family protein [Larkinella knui]
MKRITWAGIAAMTFLLIQTASAQVQVGFRAGANWGAVSKPEFLDSFSPTFRLSAGPTGALFLEVPLSDRVSIRPEISYVQKGFVIDEGFKLPIGNWSLPLGARAAYQTRYVEVPVLAKINLNEGPVQVYMLAGAAAGYAVNGRIRSRTSGIFRSQPIDVDMNMGSFGYNRWDFSAIGGLGLSAEAGPGKFFVEARYEHGFSRQYDLPFIQLPIRNRGISASIGYSFAIGQ